MATSRRVLLSSTTGVVRLCRCVRLLLVLLFGMRLSCKVRADSPGTSPNSMVAAGAIRLQRAAATTTSARVEAKAVARVRGAKRPGTRTRMRLPNAVAKQNTLMWTARLHDCASPLANKGASCLLCERLGVCPWHRSCLSGGEQSFGATLRHALAAVQCVWSACFAQEHNLWRATGWFYHPWHKLSSG